MFGGQEAGWLSLAEALTFTALAALAATGQLGLPTSRSGRLLAGSLVLASAAAVLSAVLSPALSRSAPVALEWLWLAAAAVLASMLARRRLGRELLAATFVIAVTAQVFWAFYLWWGSRQPSHAQVGTFYAPNQYAGYVLLLAPLLLGVCFTARSQITAAGAGFIAGVLFLGVALSGSRAGTVAAALGVLAAVVAIARSSWRRAVVGTLGVGVAVVALGFVMTSPLLFPATAHSSSGGLQTALAVKGTDPASLVMRLRWDLEALRFGLAHPLAGTGLGTFGAVLLKSQNPAWQWSQFAHNQYLEAFAEGGLLLLIAMVALAAVPLVAGARSLLRRGTVANPWQVGVWAGLVGGSAHLLLDHDWSYPAYAVAFVVVAVLTVAPWEGPDRDLSPLRSVRLSALVAAVAAAGLVFVIGGYLSQRFVEHTAPSASKLRLAALLAPYSSGPDQALAEQLAAKGGHPDLVRAASLLREATRRNSYEPTLDWDLAAVYVRLGDMAAAGRVYRAALSLVPGSPEAYALAANFYASTIHDPAKAVGVVNTGITRLQLGAQGAPPAPGLVALLSLKAQLELQVGNQAAALASAEQATRIGPSYSASWASLASAACAARNPVLAEQASAKATAMGAVSPPACP